MNVRSRVLPSGGSALLNAWREAYGPEAQRRAAGMAAAGDWRAPSFGRSMPPGVGLSPGMRSYMAASDDRLVADLSALLGDVSGNAEVRMGLRAMRRRSRQLANDNEYVRHFLRLVRNHVVGPHGFTLQSKVRKARKRNGKAELDVDANAEIEAAFAAHGKLGVYTACGRYSRAAFERAEITSVARDGEAIVELLYGRQFGRFGMAWRMLDPDLLDDQLNVGPSGSVAGFGRLADGHEIRMGVEVDPYGKATAYWFLQRHPGDDVAALGVVRHRRVPAERILHRFLAEELRPGTTRGVPWIFAAIRRMAMLGGYEEAALVNARTGASKMGFFVPPAPGSAGDMGALGQQQQLESMADGTTPDGADLITEAEPGSFGKLPAGWDFKKWDPAYPNDKMEGFVKAMLRAFSSAVGLTYNTLASDLEGVSLSAMRHGANNDRDTYEALQQWYREHLGVPKFEIWLRHSLAMGQVGRLPADAFERLNVPLLVGRPFRSPDPQKDVAAGAQAVALGITSRTRLCAENGVDFEEVLDELAEEERMARELGVTLNTGAASAHKTPAVDDAGKPAQPGPQGAQPGAQPGEDPDQEDSEDDLQDE